MTTQHTAQSLDYLRRDVRYGCVEALERELSDVADSLTDREHSANARNYLLGKQDALRFALVNVSEKHRTHEQ